MSAKQSAECKHGLHLVLAEGKTPYAAAKLAGVWPSTLYKALKAIEKKKIRK